MKTWLFTILGLIIFIVLGLLNQSSLEKATHQLTRNLHRVETAIQQKNWPQANLELKTIQKNWRRVKPVWSLILHHQEIDNIDQALIRTERAVQSRDFSKAQVEQGSLSDYVEHIPKRESFSLVNIL